MGFHPTDYIDIGAVREKKKAALFAHKSQNGERIYRDYHEVMENYRGREAGCGAAEGFVVGNVVVRGDDDGDRVRIFLCDRNHRGGNRGRRIAHAGLEQNRCLDADLGELRFDRVGMLDVADDDGPAQLCHPQHGLLEH